MGRTKHSFVIYKATNIINDMCYIGKTTESLETRKNRHIKSSHKSNGNRTFQDAIRINGKENFKWEIIYECDDPLILNVMETFKIMVCHSHISEGKGYNLTWGGDGAPFGDLNPSRVNPKVGNKNPFYGKKHSDKTKKVLCEKSKILCSGCGNPMYGKNHTEEAKRKIGEKSKGRKRSKEVYEKHSHHMFLILDEYNNIQYTKVLSIWCKENNINYFNMRYHMKRQEYYKGYKIKKIGE